MNHYLNIGYHYHVVPLHHLSIALNPDKLIAFSSIYVYESFLCYDW
jgi:hypothetical protein